MLKTDQNKQIKQLLQKIKPHSKLRRTWPLKGGISAEMIAFEFETTTGQTQKMIVRQFAKNTLEQNRQATSNEFKLLQILKGLGLATPMPYYLDQSVAIFSTPVLVIEYIEGEMDLCPANLNNYLWQLASQLTKIHSLNYSQHNLSFLSTQANKFAITASARRPTKLNTFLNEGNIRNVLESVSAIPKNNATALLHGDFWPGNLLWQDGKLVAVIDWEDAKLGDPLVDFANSKLEICWIFGIEAMHIFSQHYQAIMALDYSSLPYWELYAALRFIRLADFNLANLAAFFVPFGRTDITAQTIAQHYQFFIKQAFNKL